MITSYQRANDIAGVTIGYLLHALAAEQPYDHVSVEGLPKATIYVEDRAAVLTVTTLRAPDLRVAAENFAADLRCDVALVRLMARDQDFVQLTVDLTLAALPCWPWSMNDLQVWTGAGGDTWLVPTSFSPAVSLTADGFNVEFLPPYNTLAERSAGILRAAADLASFLPPREAN